MAIELISGFYLHVCLRYPPTNPGLVPNLFILLGQVFHSYRLSLGMHDPLISWLIDGKSMFSLWWFSCWQWFFFWLTCLVGRIRCESSCGVPKSTPFHPRWWHHVHCVGSHPSMSTWQEAYGLLLAEGLHSVRSVWKITTGVGDEENWGERGEPEVQVTIFHRFSTRFLKSSYRQGLTTAEFWIALNPAWWFGIVVVCLSWDGYSMLFFTWFIFWGGSATNLDSWCLV